MDIANSLHSEVASLSFSFLTSDDVKSISVKKIDNPILLDNLGLPTAGGLYDPKLGPMSARDVCETCHLSFFACPGHFGHIELPSPVYHPLYLSECLALLASTCFYCHHFKIPELYVKYYVSRLKLLDAGLIEQAHEIVQFISRATSAASKDDPAEGDDAVEEANLTVPVETAADLLVRMDGYVKAQLHEAKKRASGKDESLDSMIYEERKIARKELSARLAKTRSRCQKCRAYSPTFRLDSYSKIIELELDGKRRLANTTLGLRRPKVVGAGAISVNTTKKPKKEDPADLDEGIERSSQSSQSDDEMDGDDVMSQDNGDSEEDEDVEKHAAVARTASGKVKGSRGRNERVLPTSEVRAHLRLMFKHEHELCNLLYGRIRNPTRSTASHADMFFMDVLPVAPTRFRPASKMGDDMFENSQNSLLSAVIQTCIRIRTLNGRLNEHRSAEKGEAVLEAVAKAEGARTFELFLEALVKLQTDVNSFMDSNRNPAPVRQGKLPPPGVKQILEKKEGLFRKHMMGKRVNYAARSVISPDINIETDEIGVPPVFARKLTYPEPVTSANVHEMRQLVINGPRAHPGAAMVQNEDGTQVSLDRTTLEQRTAIANQLLTAQGDYASSSMGPPSRNKKVYRHIRDGDVVILNRQPTLHKPSMMVHKVKVLQGEKTIRMHYANCNSYNADFDGDEMNIHFPQNEVARAEAMMIANTDNQYLVPTSGGPLRGLIQDHVVAGVWMCNKASYFTRDQYFQLIYGALRTENGYTGRSRIETLPPAILKPKALWTGKQIISTIMLNLTPTNAKGLNMISKNKISHDLWGRADTAKDAADPDMSENVVVFLDGHLIRGVLDKSQYGASAFGLIHSVHELYGPKIANRLLGVLSRLFTKYLQHDAFSCRMDDLILTAEGERLRKQILDDAAEDGTKTAINYVGLPPGSKIDDPTTARNLATRLEETLRSDALMAGLDSEMQAALNKIKTKIDKDVLPAHLVRSFPDNNMQLMTISGAKGSKVNASQISTLLGQQALEGRRVPTMVSGKTLPSFKPFDTSARAGGFVANRFLTGIRPQEYYFHCMAGREGLIDTAVKTSRSGYLQRCLIKHLEGVKVHYDHTVRDSDSSVLQFLYGEDSLDVTKSQHLYSEDVDLFGFAVRNHDSLINRYRPRDLENKTTNDAVEMMKKALKKPGKYPPVLSERSPSRHMGSMSEAFAKELNRYVDTNPQGYIARKGVWQPSAYSSARITDKEFQSLARVRYMRSVVDPGEAVGLLASQGVGEPSTQMTLNTFHLAGHGAANVTLGIPRLREIIMTASKTPATPTMKLLLRDSTRDTDIEPFIKQVSKVTLSQVVERVTVTEQLAKGDSASGRQRKYTVLVELYPQKEYETEYEVTPTQVHESLAFNFSQQLTKEIKLELARAIKSQEENMNMGQGKKMNLKGDADNEADEDDPNASAKAKAAENRRRGRDDELDDDDGDAYQAKRQQQTRQLDYEDDDDNDSGIADYEDYVERGPGATAGQGAGDDEEEVLDGDAMEKAAKDQAADLLSEAFKKWCKYATSFSFDNHGGRSAQFDLEFAANAPKLLLVDIIERTCRASIIHEIPGIGRCMKVFNSKGEFEYSNKESGDRIRELVTEGCNIQGMWSLADELVDLDKLYTSDIYAILQTYGVEACRTAIINEMAAVFGVYGIKVDYRHRTVIADYMTHAGSYRAFNRTDIGHKPSPLLKASFETTAKFLADATLYGEQDDLTSPAAKIVMGVPSSSGTGSFDIRAPRVI